jgi:hypothetical protein
MVKAAPAAASAMNTTAPAMKAERAAMLHGPEVCKARRRAAVGDPSLPIRVETPSADCRTLPQPKKSPSLSLNVWRRHSRRTRGQPLKTPGLIPGEQGMQRLTRHSRSTLSSRDCQGSAETTVKPQPKHLQASHQPSTDVIRNQCPHQGSNLGPADYQPTNLSGRLDAELSCCTGRFDGSVIPSDLSDSGTVDLTVFPAPTR